ncbi:hypothetical protein NX059_010838 [Plenodomus lindquistii]|nr:hypothetical protein NX059_010838 [Plenodomus lindquistii]
MRHSSGAVGLLALPLLVGARLDQHGHAAAHNHGLRHRALEAEIVTVTDTVYQTVTVTASASTVSICSTSTSPAASSGESIIATPDAGSTSFHKLTPISGSASVKNSCDYPVYIWSVGHASCGPGKECQLIAPNSTYSETLRHCSDGGVSLKVSKTKTAERPMQFEYSVWATDNKTVSYDISYLDCMNHEHGVKDLSNCAGHDGGIQVVAGDAKCPRYNCAANEWCDVQAYVAAEFNYKPSAPVGSCAIEHGVAFELCAGN